MNVNFDKDGVSEISLTKSEQSSVRKVQKLCDNLGKLDPGVVEAADALAYVTSAYCEPDAEATAGKAGK